MYYLLLFIILVATHTTSGSFISFKEKKFKPTLKTLRVYTIIPEHLANEFEKKLPELALKQLVAYVQSNQAPSLCFLRVKGTERRALVYKGIPADISQYPALCIVSRGYAKRETMLANDYLELVRKGGGIIAAHMMLKDAIMPDIPCVCFDYPDDRPYFNFGQDLDVECLHTVWNTVTDYNPTAYVIGLGDCRGAKTLLAYATQSPKNIAALILISPFVSTKDMISQISRNYLNWIPKSDFCLRTLFECYFPSYSAQKDTLLDTVHTINPDLPIFIGQRKNDYLASDKSIGQLIARLQRAGNNSIHIAMVSDSNATHSRITPIPELQQAVKEFLKKYQLA